MHNAFKAATITKDENTLKDIETKLGFLKNTMKAATISMAVS